MSFEYPKRVKVTAWLIMGVTACFVVALFSWMVAETSRLGFWSSAAAVVAIIAVIIGLRYLLTTRSAKPHPTDSVAAANDEMQPVPLDDEPPARRQHQSREERDPDMPLPYHERRHPTWFVYNFVTYLFVAGLLTVYLITRGDHGSAEMVSRQFTLIVGTWVVAVWLSVRRWWMWRNLPISLNPDDGQLSIAQRGNILLGVWSSAPDPVSVESTDIFSADQALDEQILGLDSVTVVLKRKTYTRRGVEKEVVTVWHRVRGIDRLLEIQSYRRKALLKAQQQTARNTRRSADAAERTERAIDRLITSLEGQQPTSSEPPPALRRRQPPMPGTDE